jgi:transposase
MIRIHQKNGHTFHVNITIEQAYIESVFYKATHFISEGQIYYPDYHAARELIENNCKNHLTKVKKDITLAV